MTPFFDPSRCPICVAPLPVRPLRCPTCGVELNGQTVADLVTTLRLADSLVGQLRAQMQPAAVPLPPLSQPVPAQLAMQQPLAFQPPVSQSRPASQPPARSWFAGKSVSVILLVLGALCILAASAVFIAVRWILLPLEVRTLILVVVTTSFGLASYLALRRKLQATAEVLAVIAVGMFVLDLSAARRVGLLGLDDLAPGQHEILAGVLLVLVAGAGALAVRSRQHWLSSLDAAVGFGLARAAFGALLLADDSFASPYADPYAVATVSVAVVASLAYVACRRFRFPVATWSAVAIGGMAWISAVAIGAQQAADNTGGDLARIGDGWPSLGMALVAGLWSIRASSSPVRRVAACLSLAPLLLIFEIVGWSHGWIVGTVVMLAAFAMAALASGRVAPAWSSPVGASAVVLGLSAIAGLLPSVLTLAARLALAMFGSWQEPTFLPFGLSNGDVAPWLLPMTTLVVLALLPEVTVSRRRVTIDRTRVAGAFVAALAVLPILYGASFWVSIAVLVLVAALLLGAARLFSDDVLLVLGLLLLVIMRINAYYDLLANPLAWTIAAVATLAWALSERRSDVSAWFLTSSGLFALFAAAEWLTFTQVPRPYQGLVILAVGSLGLIASQSLRQRRLVCEALSVTWALAGLAMADGSPSHRALELTVVGVALGIVSYLSEDRRRAGWVSGVLLTLASWIRLTDINVQTVEWYTMPAAAALLVYGIQRRRQVPDESTWRCLGPGLALALTPSLLLALDEPVSWRGLFVGLASVALVGLGVGARLAAPFALGAVGTGLLALRYIWPVAAFIPRWTLLFVVGGALLTAGMTWESRVNDVRTAGRYVRGLA